MLKWLAIFAIAAIMAVGMSGEPQKRSTENENTRAARPQSNSPNKDQDSPKAPPVIVQASTPPADTSEANEEKETQRKLTSYTLWLAIFTAVLAVVSIGQGYFLHTQADHLRTHGIELRALASAAKENADAALLNAQALIKAERAWIIVDLEWPNSSKFTQLVGNSGEPITSVPFMLRCFNEGKTPCWITGKRLCAQIVDAIPEKPEMEKLPAMWTGLDPVKVGKEASPFIGATGLLGHLLEDQTLIIWGVVTYRDAFNENMETLWGYYCQPKTGGPHLRRIPESAYNRNT